MTRKMTRMDLYDMGRFPSFQGPEAVCSFDRDFAAEDHCRQMSNLWGFRLAAAASACTWVVLVWQLVL